MEEQPLDVAASEVLFSVGNSYQIRPTLSWYDFAQVILKCLRMITNILI